jgi:hypothetical protein
MPLRARPARPALGLCGRAGRTAGGGVRAADRLVSAAFSRHISAWCDGMARLLKRTERAARLSHYLNRRAGRFFSAGQQKSPDQRGFSCPLRKTRPVTSGTESESYDVRFRSTRQFAEASYPSRDPRLA